MHNNSFYVEFQKTIPLTSKKNNFEYSKEQLNVLNEVYKRHAFPDSALKEKLSIELNINKSQVTQWFTKRRFNEKRRGMFHTIKCSSVYFFIVLANKESNKTPAAPYNKENSIADKMFECAWFVMF